jgi:hypothetical protein
LRQGQARHARLTRGDQRRPRPEADAAAQRQVRVGAVDDGRPAEEETLSRELMIRSTD